VRAFCFVVVDVISEHLGTREALGASQPDARGPGRSSNYEVREKYIVTDTLGQVSQVREGQDLCVAPSFESSKDGATQRSPSLKTANADTGFFFKKKEVALANPIYGSAKDRCCLLLQTVVVYYLKTVAVYYCST